MPQTNDPALSNLFISDSYKDITLNIIKLLDRKSIKNIRAINKKQANYYSNATQQYIELLTKQLSLNYGITRIKAILAIKQILARNDAYCSKTNLQKWQNEKNKLAKKIDISISNATKVKDGFGFSDLTRKIITHENSEQGILEYINLPTDEEIATHNIAAPAWAFADYWNIENYLLLSLYQQLGYFTGAFNIQSQIIFYNSNIDFRLCNTLCLPLKAKHTDTNIYQLEDIEQLAGEIILYLTTNQYKTAKIRNIIITHLEVIITFNFIYNNLIQLQSKLAELCNAFINTLKKNSLSGFLIIGTRLVLNALPNHIKRNEMWPQIKESLKKNILRGTYEKLTENEQQNYQDYLGCREKLHPHPPFHSSMLFADFLLCLSEKESIEVYEWINWADDNIFDNICETMSLSLLGLQFPKSSELLANAIEKYIDQNFAYENDVIIFLNYLYYIINKNCQIKSLWQSLQKMIDQVCSTTNHELKLYYMDSATALLHYLPEIELLNADDFIKLIDSRIDYNESFGSVGFTEYFLAFLLCYLSTEVLLHPNIIKIWHSYLPALLNNEHGLNIGLNPFSLAFSLLTKLCLRLPPNIIIRQLNAIPQKILVEGYISIIKSFINKDNYNYTLISASYYPILIIVIDMILNKLHIETKSIYDFKKLIYLIEEHFITIETNQIFKLINLALLYPYLTNPYLFTSMLTDNLFEIFQKLEQDTIKAGTFKLRDLYDIFLLALLCAIRFPAKSNAIVNKLIEIGKKIASPNINIQKYASNYDSQKVNNDLSIICDACFYLESYYQSLFIINIDYVNKKNLFHLIFRINQTRAQAQQLLPNYSKLPNPDCNLINLFENCNFAECIIIDFLPRIRQILSNEENLIMLINHLVKYKFNPDIIDKTKGFGLLLSLKEFSSAAKIWLANIKQKNTLHYLLALLINDFHLNNALDFMGMNINENSQAIDLLRNLITQYSLLMTNCPLPQPIIDTNIIETRQDDMQVDQTLTPVSILLGFGILPSTKKNPRSPNSNNNTDDQKYEAEEPMTKSFRINSPK